MIFLLKGVGLATPSFNRFNMAQGLLRRSWFKYLNIMKKLPLPLPPPFKNSITFPTVIYNRGKVLESARENSKISSCFVLWEP